ncbi:hypothetical protein VDG1235_4054 [Verrucomicrobiia bacterium DG1235]|nr:hypothetical protein VDG1235_4054 [Verrucomicrobiae bacterium DG1235]
MDSAGLTEAYEDPDETFFNTLDPPGLPYIVVLGPQQENGRHILHQSAGKIDVQKLKNLVENAASVPKIIAQAKPERPQSQYLPPIEDKPHLAETEPSPTPATSPTSNLTKQNKPPESASTTTATNNPPPKETVIASSPTTPAPSPSAKPYRHVLASVYESMRTDDLSLAQWDSKWSVAHSNWTLEQNLTIARIDLDFLPSDRVLIGQANQIEETRAAASTALVFDRARSSYEIHAGASRGFQDYRSFWLAEFYRQGFQHDPAYQDITPSMYTGGVSASWNLPDNQGRFSFSADYQKDKVSPPYERVIPEDPREPIYTDTGLIELHTYAASGTLQRIINRRNLANMGIAISDTTGRDLRANIDFNWKSVWGEHWVSTLRGNVVEESEIFSSSSAEFGLERDWDDRWFIGASYRVYEDEGTVQDLTIVSAEAPPLETSRFGLRFIYRGERHTASLAWHRYSSRYDELGANSFQFENLYRDRDWDAIRLSFSASF